MVDVLIDDVKTGAQRGALRVPEFLDYQEQSDVFEDVIGTVSAQPMTMPTAEGARVLRVSRVTPNAS